MTYYYMPKQLRIKQQSRRSKWSMISATIICACVALLTCGAIFPPDYPAAEKERTERTTENHRAIFNAHSYRR